MSKIILVVLVFLSLTAGAQKQYIIPSSGHGPFKKGEVLNESTLLPIRKSDTFNIVPIISFELKRNHFLKGFLKTLGAGAIVYKTNEQMQVDGKGTTAANKRFGLSLGIGIAAGMPDYIKAFKNKKDPQIIYSLYNKDKLLVSRQVVKWSRKAKPVTAIAQEDGFLQVSFINGSKQIENAGDLYIDIKQTSEKSQIDSEGITNTGGGQEQLPPEEPIYVITIDGIQFSFYDRNNNGEIDSYSYSDASGVVVGNLPEYGIYYDYNISFVMSGFYPPQWDGMDEYLDWYYNYGGVEQNTVDPCDQVAQSSGTTSTNTFATTTIQNRVNQFTPLSTTTPGQNEEYFLVNNGVATAIAQLGQTGGVPQGVNSSTTIMVHTHPYGANGGLPSPSLQDLFVLDDIGSQFQASYVIAYDGTMYAMVVNDYLQLQTFIDNNQNFFLSDGVTPNIDGNTNAYNLANAIVSFRDAGLSVAEANERARAYIMGLAGVTLTKAPVGSNVYTKIGSSPKRDANGNIIKDADNLMIFEKSDCPR